MGAQAKLLTDSRSIQPKEELDPDAFAASILRQHLEGKQVSLAGISTERFQWFTDPDRDDLGACFKPEQLRWGFGAIFDVFGTRAVGKTWLCTRGIQSQNPLVYQFLPEVMVNRTPRDGEIDGYHYISMTEKKYWKALNKGEFLVAYRIGEKFAGVLWQQIAQALDEHHKILLIVNLPGYCVLQKIFPGIRACLVETDPDSYAYYRTERHLPPLPPGVIEDPDLGPYGPFSFQSPIRIPGMIRIENRPFQEYQIFDQPWYGHVSAIRSNGESCEERVERTIGDAFLQAPVEQHIPSQFLP